VAAYLGVGRRTYEKAKAVVDAARRAGSIIGKPESSAIR
jgi:hypothetical protein